MISNELTKRIMSSIILLPLAFLFIIKGSYYLNIFLILCLFISVFEWNKITKQNKHKLLGILFLVTSFFTIYKIRNSLDGEYFYLLFITIICIATDVGGFLFGKFIKGPKLTKLSPNKTYSGMIGSFILTIILVYLFSISVFFKNTYYLTIEIMIFSMGTEHCRCGHMWLVWARMLPYANFKMRTVKGQAMVKMPLFF